jgi:hypothetical protein
VDEEKLLDLAFQIVVAEERARLAEEEKPEGKKEYYKLDVTNVPKRIRLERPCLSLTLSNDGNSSVFLIVNTDENYVWQEVKAGETEKYEAGKPTIRDFKVRCEEGSTSVVRVWCVR